MKQKMHWRKWEDLATPKGEGGMGFKDFQLFNQSMLAKQGWRLMTQPESLCARVLRGKCFHGGDFMSARNKKNASHTWRAILYGREALKEGLIKRVGDGATIHAWDDPWIPGNTSRKPILKPTTANITMVSEIIDEESNTWDKEKLFENFILLDADAICKIPIGRGAEDGWAWAPEKNGQFSVRSAYRTLLALKRQGEYASTSLQEHGFWRKLWRMEVPPKIRNFWWRVIHGFIPCQEVLRNRHIEKIPFCESMWYGGVNISCVV